MATLQTGLYCSIAMVTSIIKHDPSGVVYNKFGKPYKNSTLVAGDFVPIIWS